jgi:triosephosphate isomerase
MIVSDIHIAFAGISADDLAGKTLLLAYDPPWAIKSNVGDPNTKAADPSIVADMHGLMRATIRGLFGEGVVGGLGILYGGSVEYQSTPALVAQAEVDGLLVGSASTNAKTFTELLAVVQRSLETSEKT